MANFTENIKIVIDTVTDSAKAGLSGFKSSIDEADGVTGKFKAGASSAFSTISEHAGALALGGGAALIGFGIKAVGAFTETAKSALDLGTATGLTTEQSSRWIAVADDMGVSAESLQSGIGKVAKSLDSGKWEKYGVATRDAGGNAKATNDILLDSFDMLGKIENETERARVGNDLFGKGYSSMAPMIGKTRGEMEKYLGSVEKGQVITDAEAEKAEKMRLAQDALSDALNEVTLALGGMVAGLAPEIELLAKAVTVIGSATDKLNSWTINTNATATATDLLNEQLANEAALVQNAQNSTQGYSYALDDVQASAAAAAAEVRNSTNSTEGYSYAVQDVEKSTKDATAATDAHKRNMQMMADSAKRNLDEIKGKWDALYGTIDNEQTWIDVQSAFDTLATTMEDAGKKGGKSALEIEQGYRDARSAVLEQSKAVATYAQDVLGLPVERVTKLTAMMDAGQVAEVEAILANLTRNRNANIQIISRGGAGYDGGLSGVRAAGGPVDAGGSYLVGERGPEIVRLGGQGRVYDTAESAGMLGSGASPTYITNNVSLNTPGLTENDLMRMLKTFERRNGPTFRAA